MVIVIDDADEWQNLTGDGHALTVTVIAVRRSLLAIKYDARRIE
jgi:hypothetical protein